MTRPAIAILPLDGWSSLLGGLERRAGSTTRLGRYPLHQVFHRIDTVATDAARAARDGARLASDPSAVRTCATALDALAAAARDGLRELETAPRNPLLRAFQVRSSDVAPALHQVNARLDDALAELARTPDIGVPALRLSTDADDVADAARAARRALARAELEPRLTTEERARIADAPSVGRIRRLLGSDGMRRVLGIDVLGLEHIDTARNAIHAPVHSHPADLVYPQLGHEFVTRAFANHLLWKVPGAGPLLEAAGAFPVVDGAARSGMRVATGALLDDQRLLLYPAGFVPMVPEIAPARQGAALLAIRTATDVIPIGEYGTTPARAAGTGVVERLRGPQPRAAYAYGEAIRTHHLDPDDPRDVIALTAHIEARQRELGVQARQHVLGAN